MKADLIVTDMDGTAVQYPNQPFFSSWDALIEILSEEEKRRWLSFSKAYFSDEMDYEEWFNGQVSLLRGKSVCDAEKVLFPIPYSPGFLEFFQNENDCRRGILSLGVDIVIKKIVEDVRFDYYVTQSIEVEEGSFTGKGKPFRSLDKKQLLLEMVNSARVDLERVCYVGDTRGDISCLDSVGIPVAFNPKEGLEKYVEKRQISVINDFRELDRILKKLK